jgi:hypothetical protein
VLVGGRNSRAEVVSSRNEGHLVRFSVRPCPEHPDGNRAIWDYGQVAIVQLETLIKELHHNPMKRFILQGTIHLVLAAVILVPLHASAQNDACVDVYRLAVLNQLRESTTNLSYNSATQEICEKYQQAQQKGTAVAAGASFGLFGGSVSVAHSEMMTLGRAMCSSSARESDVRNAGNITSIAGNPTALRLFNECLGKKSVIERQVTISPDERWVQVAIRFAGAGTPSVLFDDPIHVHPSNGGVFCRGRLAEARRGTPLANNFMNMTCTRRVSRQKTGNFSGDVAPSASITISTTVGTVVVQLAELRPQLMPTEQLVLASFPRGTILPWNSAEPPPAGWAVCDGQNGTPDLRGKALVGASSREELGQVRDGGVALPSLPVKVTATGWTDNMSQAPRGGPERGQHWGSQGWHPLVSQGSIPAQKLPVEPPQVRVHFIMKVI